MPESALVEAEVRYFCCCLFNQNCNELCFFKGSSSSTGGLTELRRVVKRESNSEDDARSLNLHVNVTGDEDDVSPGSPCSLNDIARMAMQRRSRMASYFPDLEQIYLGYRTKEAAGMFGKAYS